ncbi:LysR family transcriptional regulator [Marivibrio halodurans]|uniref:LysR family transcriptional regulator n=1 Tax=Marivibrio halodurans TaxID=2039722 RepID=A0A8J7S597_9PROT|nr:LysR substrate-binding domain-containing protein [Marivibrio halodurans]MBP5858778.1 LysR family transcriptional regulator [Marivibrio halodurans]
MRSLDPDHLRSFLAFCEGGTLLRAAQAVGRSPAALTAQMKLLEEAAGGPILERTGRTLALTPLGEVLRAEARSILQAHEAALSRLRGERAEERVALGISHDFADTRLEDCLRGFSTAHPGARLVLHVGTSAYLNRLRDDGALDVAITPGPVTEAEVTGETRLPMEWLAAPDIAEGARPEVLPMALLPPPCDYRTAALAALQARAVAWRVAVESQGLAGLEAALGAGLAVTARTRRWAGARFVTPPADWGLPPLPSLTYRLILRPGSGETPRALARACAALFPG